MGPPYASNATSIPDFFWRIDIEFLTQLAAAANEPTTAVLEEWRNYRAEAGTATNRVRLPHRLRCIAEYFADFPDHLQNLWHSRFERTVARPPHGLRGAYDDPLTHDRDDSWPTLLRIIRKPYDELGAADCLEVVMNGDEWVGISAEAIAYLLPALAEHCADLQILDGTSALQAFVTTVARLDPTPLRKFGTIAGGVGKAIRARRPPIDAEFMSLHQVPDDDWRTYRGPSHHFAQLLTLLAEISDSTGDLERLFWSSESHIQMTILEHEAAVMNSSWTVLNSATNVIYSATAVIERLERLARASDSRISRCAHELLG